MLPFYRYFPIWSDLYIVYGGEVDWGNDGLGIISFSNELWSRGQYFTSPELKEQQEEDPASPISDRQGSRYFFDDHLEFGDQYVEWAPFDHPQYGKVEMGGWKKTFGRLPPRFMNEELCHRNMAFTLYQADQMPQMAFGETTVEKISRDVFKIRVDLRNMKVAPTITARAAENKVVTPDLLKFKGAGFEIISVGLVADKYRPGPTELIVPLGGS